MPHTVYLTTAYLPPVQYFAHLFAAERAIEERAEHYAKQSYRNRCLIGGAQGELALTVPIERTGEKQATRDVRLSSHGNWREQHLRAIATNYESSPFYRYYADDLHRIINAPHTHLVDLNAALTAWVCSELHITTPICPNTAEYLRDVPADCDLRESIHPKRAYTGDAHFRPAPYYQAYAAQTGFLPNLSIIDLLFNLGPEARIALRSSYLP